MLGQNWYIRQLFLQHALVFIKLQVSCYNIELFDCRLKSPQPLTSAKLKIYSKSSCLFSICLY